MDSQSNQVERAIEEYIGSYEQAAAESPEGFAQRFAPELRARILQGCQDYLSSVELLRPRKQAESGHIKVLGPYQLGEVLNSGGTATVYAAIDTRTGQEVAIKVLHEHLSRSLRSLERFKREARLGQGLRYQHLAAVTDVGSAGDRYYLVMDRVYQRSLADYIRDSIGGQRGERAIELAVRVTGQIARALHYLHENGVYHRDVKPHNILLDDQNEAFLADLGLAKIEETSLSFSGRAVGTLWYMSPEEGVAHSLVDHRTDVYSLGVVLYETLTLRRPFEGDTPERILYRINFACPSTPSRLNPSVPSAVEAICLKAMEKVPAHRFASALEFAEDLERVQRLESPRTRPKGPFVRLWRSVTLRPWRWAGVLGIALTIAGFFAVDQWQESKRLAHDLTAIVDFIEGARADAQDNAELEKLLNLCSVLKDRYGEGVAYPVAEARRMIAFEGRERLDRARERLISNFSSPPGTDLESYQFESQPELFRAFVEMVECAALLPLDDTRRASATMDSFFPQLIASVSAGPARVPVVLYETNWATGDFATEGIRLGKTPLDIRVPPGRYRIVIGTPSSFAECTRALEDWGQRYEISVTLDRTTKQITESMVLLPSSPFVAGFTPGDPLPLKTYQIPAFYIDPFETTCGEYREFMKATGYPAPTLWPNPYDSAWDDHPVVGVDPADARSYAEWAGMRLPTMLEWERVARGTDGREYPWGGDSQRLAKIKANLYSGNLSYTDPEWVKQYLNHVRPVGTAPNDQRREDDSSVIYDCLGNVAEYVDSVIVARYRGRVFRRTSSGCVKGGSYWKYLPPGPFGGHRLVPLDKNKRPPVYGFRCAKSWRQTEQ